MDAASIRRVIDKGRALSLVRMLDTCAVTRPGTGDGTVDANGDYTPAAETAVWAGACWLGSVEALTDPAARADQVLVETRLTLVVPHDAGPFAVGDIVTMTSARDPHMGSRTWRIAELPTSTWQIDRRIPVEEVTDGP